MRTLIVEDDITNQILLQSFLSKYGECKIAANGKLALEAFSAAHKSGQDYDLICMDIMMPEMDGQAAIKGIRVLEEAAGKSSTNSVKIIMTTAAADMENIRQSFSSLCDAYLFKPIDTGKLLGHIRDFHLV
jgi:two-component system, chemotaxis family, chemotaxis protein CheY